jgi:hypothetical protein
MKRFFVLTLFVLLIPCIAGAQWDFKVDTTLSGYRFKSTIDTVEYSTTLTITKGSKKIFSETYFDYLFSVEHESMNKNGDKYYFIGFYSGGAHCCSGLLIAKIENDKFIKLDSAIYGNSGFVLQDLNKDGAKEILSGNDMFAYTFTNYSETRFPLRVQEFDGKRIKDITGKFKGMINEELVEFKKDLDEIVKEGFECPAKDGEDTFNTDAGSVKTILAAIVADYYSLGEVEKGYALVDKVYKCPDRDSFKNILKKDFKLK